MLTEATTIPRSKFNAIVDNEEDNRHSSSSTIGAYYYDQAGSECSPGNMSPWNQTSPFAKSPWSSRAPMPNQFGEGDSANFPQNGLIGSLVREEGHIYSLACTGDLLYTGSDSKNIRVWKNLKEFSGFKSASGLVKAIVISGEKIFTGHQDGKIRVWRISAKNAAIHKRVGTLPRLKDLIKSSIKPSNYVEVRRRRNALWIKHYDAISCLSLNEDQGLLYSGSWDKTLKVWRISDSKCLESINAHNDAVNSVVTGFDGLVFTGSADGTVKVWRREIQPKGTKHPLLNTLLKQESAVTALAVNPSSSVLYAGSSDGVVNFWELGRLTRRYVWRRDGGVHACLSVLTGHTGPVKCLGVEEDGESRGSDDQRWKVYSGSLDKSVKVWRVFEAMPDLQGMAAMQQKMVGGLDEFSLPSPGDSFPSSQSLSPRNKKEKSLEKMSEIRFR
ncbi:hypothetical protein Syun_025040 [Stephania yunnanensis]|uniref:Uncharacterized protein n=1 Tax=Stephania yunnanensis TaxID=152371 RepID=A0AAP0HVV5_9MAGN